MLAMIQISSEKAGSSNCRPGPILRVVDHNGPYGNFSPENGRELFYLAPTRQIMVVTYSAQGESFGASKPRLWSEVRIADRPNARDYDLHPDGERFAVLMPAQEQVEQERDHVVLIQNFFELLRQEVGN